MPEDGAPRAAIWSPQNDPKRGAVKQRLPIYRDVLLRLNKSGQTIVALKGFADLVAMELGQKVLGIHSVRSDLEGNRQYFEREGYRLIVSKAKRTVEFRRENASDFDLQASQAPDLKVSLGRLIWWLLFGVGERPECTFVNEDKVLPRIVALRSRPLATIFFDAGTTVHEAAKALIQMPSLPIRVVPTPEVTWSGAPAGGGGRPSLVSIRPVTHSLPVMETWRQSSEQERLAEPIFLGGQYRYKSQSLGGLLAEICMREWGLRFDVAIMGSSGYVPGPDGGFGSGIADEVQTKLLFLSRSLLRVFLCHSTKLRGDSNPLTVFAPINSTHVDLVVTDDGSRTGSRDDVTKFQEHARQAGVAAVILKGPVR